MGQIPSSLGPPDVIYPAVNDYRQQQFQVEPEREVAVSLLGAQVVHDLRLVQLRLQLVTQVSRHCRETQSKLEPSPTPTPPPARLDPLRPLTQSKRATRQNVKSLGQPHTIQRIV